MMYWREGKNFFSERENFRGKASEENCSNTHTWKKLYAVILRHTHEKRM